MKLFRTPLGTVLEVEGRTSLLSLGWDEIFQSAEPRILLRDAMRGATVDSPALIEAGVLAPIDGQEVWAAGDDAQRPELFFKSNRHRTVGPHGQVRLRANSRWNVPEPELVVAVNSTGKIFGYTVGNDMTSRDLEGESSLYRSQAKVYDGSCALGPCIVISDDPPRAGTTIQLEIMRRGELAFAGETTLEQLKRKPTDLVSFLFQDSSFPSGVLLMTGTGIVPPSNFTLASGDEIRIEIEGVGRLVNTVAP